MLVLSRLCGERIVVTVPPSPQPQTVIVCVVDTNRGKARIGFEASRDVCVDREEVHTRKLTETRRTA
jgi:sRNA-binding carbon storage regulator CsrA